MAALTPKPGRDQRGQALVEMAILLPILLVLLVGVVELGRAWNVRQVLTHAAREGARIAVVPAGTGEGALDAVTLRLQDAAVDADECDIDIEGIDGGAGTATTVTVSCPYRFLFLAPIVPLIDGDGSIPGTMTLTATATMRNE